MEDPQAITAMSIMPAYPGMISAPLDFERIQRAVDAFAMLGVPYGDAVNNAPDLARAQAAEIAAEIEAQGGPGGLGDKEIVAMVAYLQRLGVDATRAPVATASASAPESVEGENR
jgi:cytochrome c oxidase cbb3-type subunit I/II